MSRTTSAAVEAIIDVDSSISVTPFIEAANALVTEVCGDVSSYDSTRLELIERWLSAHFYATRDMVTTRERADRVEATYMSKVDLGFDLTHYGQMAMRLDTNGGLANLNLRIKKGLLNISSGVGVTWLGTEEVDVETE